MAMCHYHTLAASVGDIPSVGDITLYPATISYSSACLKIRVCLCIPSHCTFIIYSHLGEDRNSIWLGEWVALFPGPCAAFGCTKKRGGPGMFPRVCDVEGRKVVERT